jgi:DNA polymerase-3 subunit delta'
MPFRDVIGHERPKMILRAAIEHDRVAHAYLFHGEEQIGKRLVAIAFAQALSCESPSRSEPDACGTCRACRQVESRSYPDFFVIEPDREQANPQIKIEQVRELEDQIVYRPLVSSRKICLIDEADRMTPAAANALLKTLEEPPGHSLFLLVTSRPFALPATIRSRCHGIQFVTPPRRQVEAALMARRGLSAPDARLLTLLTDARIGEAMETDLEAIRTAHNEFGALTSPAFLRSPAEVLTAAEILHKSDRAAEALNWIARWSRDLLLVKAGADVEHLLNPERLSELREAASQIEVDGVLDLLEELERIERAGTRNINLQLALETVLLRLRDVLAGQSPVQVPAPK